jgi:hypothetical protein
MVAALLLRIVQSYAAQTAARGTDIVVVDALHMLLVSVLVLLILRQVMPIAAGLAGGVSLNSFGLMSRSIGSGLALPGRMMRAKQTREFMALYRADRAVGMARLATEPLTGAASQPKPAVDGNANTGARANAGADDAALGQNWRHPRR